MLSAWGELNPADFVTDEVFECLTVAVQADLTLLLSRKKRSIGKTSAVSMRRICRHFCNSAINAKTDISTPTAE